MTVMFFNHARVGMPQVLGHYEEGYAVHGGKICPSVAQRMEINGRVDLSPSARLGHRPKLMTFLPRGAIGLEESRLAAGSLQADLFEKGCTVISQDDVAWLTSFADADRDGPRVWVEVIYVKPNELAIAGTRFQCAPNETSKSGVAGIQEALAFGNRKVVHAGRHQLLRRA